jgi:hypothetical protein
MASATKAVIASVLVILLVSVLCVVLSRGSFPASVATDTQLVTAATTTTSKCNFPASHGFLVWPAEPDCKYVYMSHGSEFECPHTYDVKLLAEITSETQQRTFCKAWHSASRKDFMVGLMLQQNGLPGLIAGKPLPPPQQSEGFALYHPFFNPQQTAPGPTELQKLSLKVKQVLYGRDYAPETGKDDANLYLLFAPKSENGPKLDMFASHTIYTPPSFDAIYKVSLVNTTTPLSSTSPALLSFDSGFGLGIHQGESDAGNTIVNIQQTIYTGVNDGFVLLDKYCPNPTLPGSNKTRPLWLACTAK